MLFTQPFPFYSRCCVFPILPPSKAMAELRVSELMKASSSPHAKVAPNILAAPEVKLLNSSYTTMNCFKLNKIIIKFNIN